MLSLTNKTLNELQELEATIVKTLSNAPVKLNGESEIKENLFKVRAKIQEIKTAEAEEYTWDDNQWFEDRYRNN